MKKNAYSKGLLNDSQEVDALCMDLMSNLQEAIHNSEQHINGESLDKNLNHTKSSGFSYVDLQQYQNGSQYSEVVLRRNGEQVNGDRNSSSTTESVYTEEDLDDSESEDESSDTDSSSSEERVHIVNEGLETITEEDRPVTASSVRSKEGKDKINVPINFVCKTLWQY